MYLYQPAEGLYQSVWNIMRNAEHVAEIVATRVRVLNIMIANLFRQYRGDPALYATGIDQILRAVIDINGSLDRLVQNIEYESLRQLRRHLIYSRAQNVMLRTRFFELEQSIQQDLDRLFAHQQLFERLWEAVGRGPVNMNLRCEVRTRQVRRAARGFLQWIE